MPDAQFHLAQMNIGRLVAPLDDPRLADFAAGLVTLNALADASPGFVWRLQSDAGNATDFRPYPEDETILLNMSVWTSLEALSGYVYRSDHAGAVRRRREWFKPFEGPFQTLWWLPAGTRPTFAEARERLAHLRDHGPTPYAFTFREPFKPDAPAG